MSVSEHRQDFPSHSLAPKSWPQAAISLATLMWMRALRQEIGTREYVLLPGDCLYIPRGWAHEAKTTDDSPASLHLSVGFEVEPFMEWSAALHVLLRKCACLLPTDHTRCNGNPPRLGIASQDEIGENQLKSCVAADLSTEYTSLGISLMVNGSSTILDRSLPYRGMYFGVICRTQFGPVHGSYLFRRRGMGLSSCSLYVFCSAGLVSSTTGLFCGCAAGLGREPASCLG
jgi:hypothetical protein